MPNVADIEWFKSRFHGPINAAVEGTPFDLDFLTAIACQETGDIWTTLRRKNLGIDEILALCVGDTIDAKPNGKGRKAFPKSKADLLAVPDGDTMFAIARAALVAMAKHISGYQSAVTNQNKFCHGFGLFQYDLQFFTTDPDYFLNRRYERLEGTLGKCLEELRAKQKRIGLGDRTSLDDHELVAVAIAYNTGTFKPALGLRQGHKNGEGKFYGELVNDFLRVARQTATPGGAPAIAAPLPGQAAVPPPTAVSATGPFLVVDTSISTLYLRSQPKKSVPPKKNVITDLPDGHPVRAIDTSVQNGYREVETSLAGAHFRGFAAAEFLKSALPTTAIPIVVPAPTPPTSGIVAVSLPHPAGHVTKRTAVAGAHSLNEPGQPGRKGTTADELRAELAAIVEWLAVDKASFKRYQPRNGLTFCNIYAHDYCDFAGVYLPRVWWTSGAIERLSAGETAAPLYGDTIREMHANDLFRWLRDFGPRFGWRQTGTLSKIQQEANQGAIGLIVARRTEEGRSGHIVVVVPETEDARARRAADGQVLAPLQSQAGASNFRYGTGANEWWKGAQFAESAFWLHA